MEILGAPQKRQWHCRVVSRQKMVAPKRYGLPWKCPSKWKRKKRNCCCLITFSSKQWAFLCSFQKNILYSLRELAKNVQNNVKLCWYRESRPYTELKTSPNFFWMRHCIASFVDHLVYNIFKIQCLDSKLLILICHWLLTFQMKKNSGNCRCSTEEAAILLILLNTLYITFSK